MQQPIQTRLPKPSPLGRYLPVLQWASRYQRSDLVGDLLAGSIVAIMLVPQAMAYALLAGLPPQVGLYASILPLIIYGLLGTSRSLAVGPVAIVSLLVASGIAPLTAADGSNLLQLALTLALLVALIQTSMGLLRVGFVVNFMSHPVLSGFTSAAALVIGASQLKHLLGISIPNGEFFDTIWHALTHIAESNPITLAIGLGSIAILIFSKNKLGQWLQAWGVAKTIALPIAKSAPLLVVLLGSLAVWLGQLDQTAVVAIVGTVPAGLPSLTLPSFAPSVWQTLLPTALVISFVGYMESIAVAKSLASKRRQTVEPNQELIALGFANLGAAFTGGYPVTGGFSRSVVNYDAGANTGLASVITALLVAITVIFLTPLFYFLPNAVLAAIVLVAVAGLIDIATLRHVWHYNKADAASLLITFGAVLAVGIENGILAGVATALLLHIWRTSKPHVAVVGRLPHSEIYRNVQRHQVETCPHVVAVRVDESLYFANTKFLEDTIWQLVHGSEAVEAVVLIGTAVNHIDASALETLETLSHDLHDAGITLHFAAIKGPVMDKLRASSFVKQLGEDHFFMTTHDAMLTLGCWQNERK